MTRARKDRTAIEQVEWMRNLLAFLLVGAFVGMIPVFVFVTIPSTNEQIITYMLGQLSGMAITVLGFYFINKVGQDALDATRADNTGKMADLAKTALETGGGAADPSSIKAGDEVTINKSPGQDEAVTPAREE